MYWLYRIALLIALLSAAACAQDVSPDTPAPDIPSALAPDTPTASPDLSPSSTPAATSTPVGQAVVRFVNAAPGAPPVNIMAGPLAIATNLDFSRFTEPTTLSAGDYQLRVMPAGARPGAASLLESALTFNHRDSLLVILAGTPNNLELLAFPEDAVPLAAGESAVTFINLLNGTAGVALAQDAADLIPPAGYGQRAKAAVLKSGQNRLAFRQGETAIYTYETDLREGFHYTLILAGEQAAPSAIQMETRAPGRTSVRLIQASTIGGALDVYLDDQLLAGGAEFGRPLPRQEAATGDHIVRIYAAGSSPAAEPLAEQTIQLDLARYTALLILGSAENLRVLTFPEDLSPTPPRLARIAFLNTLDIYPRIQLETSGGPLPGVPDIFVGQPPVQTWLAESSFSFYWSEIAPGEGGDTVEIAENVQLRAGYTYLYLVTGRIGSPPIILSDNVGVDENLRDPLDDSTVEGAADAPLVRLVNALEDQMPVDFTVGQTPLAAVAYGEGTELLAVPQREPVISVGRDGGTLATADITLQNGQTYTVIASGSAEAGLIRLLVLLDSDLIFSGDAPRLRLINTSLDRSVRLGLAYSVAAPEIENLPEGTDEPTIDDFRRTIPFGVYTLVNDVSGAAWSGIIMMPAGEHNLDILDSARGQLAASIAFADLRAGVFYDVIAYQEDQSFRVRAFLLEYPR
ncbi:MAG: hypothetical protein BroJett038_08840 [Chloroflexota bacterium]|nr:MAG: hypothetical protein BroJett038_08840 [Chloroflexota bacterium]